MESKAKKPFNKAKFWAFFTPTLYLVFAVIVCVVGVYIFNSYYYTTIFVSGSSMLPTLVGGTIDSNLRNHYGISDTSAQAINNLKRFDVVVTYYPWTKDDDVYKIKRIWGLPGETINLTYDSSANVYTFTAYKGDKKVNEYHSGVNEMSFDLGGKNKFVSNVTTFKDGKRTFHTRLGTYRHINNYTLQNDEYFLMGDNWAGSSDCYTNIIEGGSTVKLTKKNLQGKVVAIEGTATYNTQTKKLENLKKFAKRMYNF